MSHAYSKMLARLDEIPRLKRNRMHANVASIRLWPEERAVIKQAVKTLGISEQEFFRSLALEHARGVIEDLVKHDYVPPHEREDRAVGAGQVEGSIDDASVPGSTERDLDGE